MKFRNKTLLFLILCAVTHSVLYFVFYRIANKENPLVKQMALCKANKKAVKVLIAGDSHAERGIDVSIIDSALNLSYYGENNMFTYYKLKYCLENFDLKPKYVVLPCDIPTFANGFNHFRINNFFYYSLVGFKDIKDMRDEPVVEYYRYFKIKLFPYTDWKYALDLAGKTRAQKAKGAFSDKNPEEQMANARNFLQKELNCAGRRENLFFSISIEYLNKTLALCKEYNIKPVFVKYPLTQQVFDVVKNEVDSTALQIRNRPPEMLIRNQNIPVLNFEYLYAQKPELFFDCHHLNNAGKAAFTPIFKQKLDSLLRVY